MENINSKNQWSPTDIGDIEGKYLVLKIKKIYEKLHYLLEAVGRSNDGVKDWVNQRRQKKNMLKFLQCLEEWNIEEIIDGVDKLFDNAVECSCFYNGLFNPEKPSYVDKVLKINREEETRNFIDDFINEARALKWELGQKLINAGRNFNTHHGIDMRYFDNIFRPRLVNSYLAFCPVKEGYAEPEFEKKITDLRTEYIDDGDYLVWLKIEGDESEWCFDVSEIEEIALGFCTIKEVWEDKKPENKKIYMVKLSKEK